MTNRDMRGLEQAATYAACSPCRVQVGAWCNGRGSFNTNKTHPALLRYNYPKHCNRHAELGLGLKLGYMELEGRTVYVARLLRNEGWALARPCLACANMLAELGVKKVVYTVGPDRGEIMTL